MFIDATGMVCSVGLSAAAACAAMRAGIAKFDELPYISNGGEPIIGAVVPGLNFGMKRGERLVEMLAMAVADCLGQKPSVPTESVPLLVGLAEPERPGGGADRAESILRGAQEKLGRRFHPKLSRTIDRGHTAGFEGLRLARNLLQDPETPACLVCGVDSSINASSLYWLDRHWRLKTEQNSDGVIPGEAAAAVLLARAPVAGAEIGVCVAGLGFAHEKTHVLSDEPFLGLGLADATRRALAEAAQPLNQMTFRLSDVTGESYGFKEQSLTLSRVLRQGPSQLPLWHCADAIGDTGAAASICQLVRGCHAITKGYAPGDRAIGFASSAFGERAAVILQRQRNAAVSKASKG